MKTLRALLLFVVPAVLLAGCAGTAQYVDPGSGQGVITVGQINTQDYDQAAERIINSLLKSRAIESTDGRRMVIMLGKIDNATFQYVQTDLWTKGIRKALNNSGKAVTTTAMGPAGPEDPSVNSVRQLRASSEVDQSTVPGQGQVVAPDYSLSGKIIELPPVRSGRVRQTTFSFQLALTDLRTGLALWEDEVKITKMGARPAVSW